MRVLMKLALAVGAMSLASMPTSAQDMPATHLKVVGLWSHLNSFQTGEKPFWEETIPSASNGQITATITPLDLLGLQGGEILRLMRLGVIDLASGAISYMSGDSPEFDGLDLAGLSPDMATTRSLVDAYRPTLERIMDEDYEAKLLMLFPSPPQVFWCKAPVANLGDLQGLTVRTFNTSMADFVSGLGATTVSMPFGEVATSLDRGVIDCAITGTLSGNTSKLHEVTTHLVPLYAGWSIAFTAVSKQTWDSLDASVQDFLLSHLGELEERLWDTVAEEEQDGINCSIGQEPCKYGFMGSMTLVELSQEDRARAREIVAATVVPAWARRCGADCVADWNARIGPIVGIEAAAN